MGKGNPLYYSAPYFIGKWTTRTDLRDCFNFSSLPNSYEDNMHLAYLFVEPMTGVTVGGRANIQANIAVQKSVFNSGLWDNIFKSTGCDDIIWPVAIKESASTMKRKDADTFHTIYDAFEM